jgi:hypothetical protein
MAPETAHLVSAILNAAYMVRHYARGGRLQIERDKRKKAIREMGLTVRDAFNSSDDFEALLAAVVDGLSPKDMQPF